MSRPPIAWSRMFVEGIVIVVSILLAFAIDAWWDDRQKAEEARLQVERVVAELEANIARLKLQIENLNVTTSAGKRFLSKFGPEPEPVTKAEVAELFDKLYSSGTIALNRSASQSFLSSGILTQGDWLGIRRDLSGLLSYQDVSEKRSVELREMRPAISRRTGQVISTLDTALTHEVMADYSPSRFPYDPTTMFSDMYLEGLFAEFAIRMEINRLGHKDLLKSHQALIDEINATRGL
jgi:hypothetical protein